MFNIGAVWHILPSLRLPIFYPKAHTLTSLEPINDAEGVGMVGRRVRLAAVNGDRVFATSLNKPTAAFRSVAATTSRPSSLAHNERIRQYALVYCRNGGLLCREPLPSPMILPLSQRDAKPLRRSLRLWTSARKPWSKRPAMLAGPVFIAALERIKIAGMDKADARVIARAIGDHGGSAVAKHLASIPSE